MERERERIENRGERGEVRKVSYEINAIFQKCFVGN